VNIHLPALRNRKEDLPILVQRFLSRSDRPVTLRQDALDKIMTHAWPGNVRELENVVTRAIVLAPGGVITPECIQFPQLAAPSNEDWLNHIPFREGYWEVIHKVQAELLRASLAETGGNKTEAARILGIQRRLLYEKLTEFGMQD
jgi:DNA-binding NtrC family response regulator